MPLKLRRDASDGNLRIFDPLRRKYVALTPEEYVRQHFVNWMCTELHYPASIVANEVGLRVNGTPKRCDTVVFGPDGRPVAIVEYKAPTVSISQSTFDQIARYSIAFRARYLIVSNGLQHYCCVMDHHSGTYHFIPRVPDYAEICQSSSQN